MVVHMPQCGEQLSHSTTGSTPPCPSRSLSLFLSLANSLYLSLSLSRFISISLPLLPSLLSLSLSFSLSLSLCLSLSLLPEVPLTGLLVCFLILPQDPRVCSPRGRCGEGWGGCAIFTLIPSTCCR